MAAMRRFTGLILAVSVLMLVGCSGGGGGNGTSGGNTDGSSGGGGGATSSNTANIVIAQPPAVVAKSTDGSNDTVDTAAAISVTFSTDMDPSTITDSTFTIAGTSGAVTNDTATSATFTPSTKLAYDTAYTATISTGAKDTAGNALASNFSWTFTTAQNPSPPGPHQMGGAIQGSQLVLPDVMSILAGGFNSPEDVTTDGTNIYVADTYNNEISEINITSGAVSVLAGAGSGSPGSTDGTGTAATFNWPSAITTDGTNLYVVEINNDDLRKIDIASGKVTTLVPANTFYTPEGITTDGTNLYVADTVHNAIKEVSVNGGVISNVAGSGAKGSSDAIGTAATFDQPAGITTDGNYLYVADSLNHKIRKIELATGQVTTLAGTGSCGSSDGIGTAASFCLPYGISTDGNNLYVTELASTDNIRKIVIATGSVTTLLGGLNNPHGITTDDTNLYVANTNSNNVVQIAPDPSALSTPSAPASVSVTTGDALANISWPDVPGATSYNLYCAAGTGVTPASGTLIDDVASPYQLCGCWTASPITPSNGTTYSCVVTAVNSYGESVASSPVSFTPAATYTLSVSKTSTNNGDGVVSSSPSGINCGSTCTATVTNGGAITLAATPSSGSTFTGWSGACSGTGSCTLTMNADQSVTANFQGTTSTGGGGGSGAYYWANWSCGTDSNCATVMGAYSGSAGPMCTLSDCTAWGNKYIAGGYSCSTSATSSNTTTGTPANGSCYQSGVDF